MHKHEDVEKKPESGEERAPGHKYFSEEVLQEYAAIRGRKLSNPGERPEITVKWLPRVE